MSARKGRLPETMRSMTAAPEVSPSSHHRMRRGIFAGVVLLALLILVVGYVRLGWDRMESACTADRPGSSQTSSVAFEWSWSPPGFTCTYDEGRTETSLWF
jgi:hypothetical protein